jgi:hypothetical protein
MKRVAFALGFAGVALISYATLRGGTTRHKLGYFIPGEAFASSRYESQTTPAESNKESLIRSDASVNLNTHGVNPVPLLPAEVELTKAQECFNSNVPCAEYSTSSYHDYQVDILTHMQAIAEGEYISVLQDPSKKTAAHEVFARELLANPQPELQFVGIKFLDMFDPNKENLESLSNCLGHTLSEELFEQGVQLIRAKYKDHGDYDEDIREMLAQQIQFGIDETTSHRAAQELFQYLDKNSFRNFLVLEQKLVPFHERYMALNSVLNEYAAIHHFEP